MAVEHQKLRFNLDKTLDAEAWNAVQAVLAGQRNQFILNAIRSYTEQQTQKEQQQVLAKQIADLVVGRLSAVTVTTAAPVSACHDSDTDVYEQSMAIADDFMDNW